MMYFLCKKFQINNTNELDISSNLNLSWKSLFEVGTRVYNTIDHIIIPIDKEAHKRQPQPKIKTQKEVVKVAPI